MKLDKAIKKLNEEFGGIFLLGDESPQFDREKIPIDLYALDKIIGIDGLPMGMIYEIYGPESGGKTTLAGYILSQFQKKFPDSGGLYIDAEHRLEIPWLKRIGVDLSRMPLKQPDSGEEALNLANKGMELGIRYVVIDSASSLEPRRMLNKAIGEGDIASLALLLSQSLKRLEKTAAKTNSILLFTNQIREAGIGSFKTYETTPGGRALKHAANLRIRVAQGKRIKEGDTPIGHIVRLKCNKNSVAPPYKESTFTLYYDGRLSCDELFVEMAKEKGLITMGETGWITVKETGDKIQGQRNFMNYLKTNPDFKKLLEK